MTGYKVIALSTIDTPIPRSLNNDVKTLIRLLSGTENVSEYFDADDTCLNGINSSIYDHPLVQTIAALLIMIKDNQTLGNMDAAHLKNILDRFKSLYSYKETDSHWPRVLLNLTLKVLEHPNDQNNILEMYQRLNLVLVESTGENLDLNKYHLKSVASTETSRVRDVVQTKTSSVALVLEQYTAGYKNVMITYDKPTDIKTLKETISEAENAAKILGITLQCRLEYSANRLNDKGDWYRNNISFAITSQTLDDVITSIIDHEKKTEAIHQQLIKYQIARFNGDPIGDELKIGLTIPEKSITDVPTFNLGYERRQELCLQKITYDELLKSTNGPPSREDLAALIIDKITTMAMKRLAYLNTEKYRINKLSPILNKIEFYETLIRELDQIYVRDKYLAPADFDKTFPNMNQLLQTVQAFEPLLSVYGKPDSSQVLLTLIENFPNIKGIAFFLPRDEESIEYQKAITDVKVVETYVDCINQYMKGTSVDIYQAERFQTFCSQSNGKYILTNNSLTVMGMPSEDEQTNLLNICKNDYEDTQSIKRLIRLAKRLSFDILGTLKESKLKGMVLDYFESDLTKYACAQPHIEPIKIEYWYDAQHPCPKQLGHAQLFSSDNEQTNIEDELPSGKVANMFQNLKNTALSVTPNNSYTRLLSRVREEIFERGRETMIHAKTLNPKWVFAGFFVMSLIPGIISPPALSLTIPLTIGALTIAFIKGMAEHQLAFASLNPKRWRPSFILWPDVAYTIFKTMLAISLMKGAYNSTFDLMQSADLTSDLSYFWFNNASNIAVGLLKMVYIMLAQSIKSLAIGKALSSENLRKFGIEGLDTAMGLFIYGVASSLGLSWDTIIATKLFSEIASLTIKGILYKQKNWKQRQMDFSHLLPIVSESGNTLQKVKSFLNILWIWDQKENGAALIDEFKKSFSAFSDDLINNEKRSLNNDQINLDPKIKEKLEERIVPDFKKAMKVKS